MTRLSMLVFHTSPVNQGYATYSFVLPYGSFAPLTYYNFPLTRFSPYMIFPCASHYRQASLYLHILEAGDAVPLVVAAKLPGGALPYPISLLASLHGHPLVLLRDE